MLLLIFCQRVVGLLLMTRSVCAMQSVVGVVGAGSPYSWFISEIVGNGLHGKVSYSTGSLIDGNFCWGSA